MSDFFSIFFHKAAAAVAGTLITIGLVSAPVSIPETPAAPEVIEAQATTSEPVVIIQAPKLAGKKKFAPIAVASSTPQTATTTEPAKEKSVAENKSKPADSAVDKEKRSAEAQEWCKKMVSLSTVNVSGGYMGTEYAEQYYTTLLPPATTTIRSDVGVNGAGKRGYWKTNTSTGMNEYVDVDREIAEYNIRYNAYINDKLKVKDQHIAYSEARDKCPEDQRQKFASNVAVQAIDAFLSDPTINNLKTFCTNAKSIIGYDTERNFNADRTDFIYRPLTLYENLKNVCSKIIDQGAQRRGAPSYSWVEFKYDDHYLLPLTNNSESDNVRAAKIEYNNKIKSLAQYKLIGFSNQRGSDIIEVAQKTAEKASPSRWASVMTSFLDSFIIPESDLVNAKTKIQPQLIGADTVTTSTAAILPTSSHITDVWDGNGLNAVTYYPITSNTTPSYSPSQPITPAITYSDYNFTYQWNQSNGVNILTCPMTPRNIVIKKAVFKISDSELQKLNEIKSFEADGFKVNMIASGIQIPNISRSPVYNLEESSANTFVYFGGSIPVCTDGGAVSISDMGGTLNDITNQGRNVKIYLAQKGITDGITSGSNSARFSLRLSPVMTGWEMWDNTTNKAVKIP